MNNIENQESSVPKTPEEALLKRIRSGHTEITPEEALQLFLMDVASLYSFHVNTGTSEEPSPLLIEHYKESLSKIDEWPLDIRREYFSLTKKLEKFDSGTIYAERAFGMARLSMSEVINYLEEYLHYQKALHDVLIKTSDYKRPNFSKIIFELHRDAEKNSVTSFNRVQDEIRTAMTAAREGNAWCAMLNRAADKLGHPQMMGRCSVSKKLYQLDAYCFHETITSYISKLKSDNNKSLISNIYLRECFNGEKLDFDQLKDFPAAIPSEEQVNETMGKWPWE